MSLTKDCCHKTDNDVSGSSNKNTSVSQSTPKINIIIILLSPSDKDKKSNSSDNSSSREIIKPLGVHVIVLFLKYDLNILFNKFSKHSIVITIFFFIIFKERMFRY